jgi:hypothetical protein
LIISIGEEREAPFPGIRIMGIAVAALAAFMAAASKVIINGPAVTNIATFR